MEAKATAALLGLFAFCGLVMAVLTGFFTVDQGGTGTSALTLAVIAYVLTVATFGKVVGRSGTSVVIRSALLLLGAAVAILGAVLLRPAGIRLTPAT